MRVIVDTCVWSLALRRGKGAKRPEIDELRNLVLDHRVEMLGPIRQEILSGVRDEKQFDKLRIHFESFPDLPMLTEDYVTAARFFNLCRSKGIQGSNTDFLICAVAARNRFSVFTTDKDFEGFSKHLPITLYSSQ